MNIPGPVPATITIETPPEEALVLDATRAEPKPVKQFFLGLVIFLIAAGIGGVATGVLNAVVDTQNMQGFEWLPLTVGMALEAILSIVGFLWLFPKLVGRKPFELMGPGAWRELGIGLAIGAVLIGLSAVVLGAMGVYRVTDVSLNGGVIVGIMLGIGAAFGEEIFFRGFLLRLLDKRFGAWVATLSISLLFGLIHLINPGATVWGALAIAVTAGPLLNAAYLLTRRLWLPIGIHLAWNAVQSAILGIDVSGSGSGRGLFESKLSGPELLSGGSMGIEGSLILVVIAAAAGVWILVLAQRRGRMLPRRRIIAT